MRRPKLAAALVSAALLVSGALAPAPSSQAAPRALVPKAALPKAPIPKALQAKSCKGVWVVVDTGKKTMVKCAKKYTTGLAALKSAGFKIKDLDGFVCQINKFPSKCEISWSYWSYWHATYKNGKWSSWKYSNVGSNTYRPKKNTAEGWRFVKGGSKAVPRTMPPKR
ncbi:MAG: hypothetical protein LBR21_09030 [Propionibacteriaceae bacterium]|jgi:hypothetical protein|nr:hypothetical protein [Propionibacteriaceae bacterium]